MKTKNPWRLLALCLLTVLAFPFAVAGFLASIVWILIVFGWETAESFGDKALEKNEEKS